MRKLLAILLLLLANLPLATPLLALTTSPVANLPICCRRNGAHHCLMTLAERTSATASTTPTLSSPAPRCPFCPASLLTAHHDLHALTPLRDTALSLPIHTTAAARQQAPRSLLHDRSCPQRGPPANLG